MDLEFLDPCNQHYLYLVYVILACRGDATSEVELFLFFTKYSKVTELIRLKFFKKLGYVT